MSINYLIFLYIKKAQVGDYTSAIFVLLGHGTIRNKKICLCQYYGGSLITIVHITKSVPHSVCDTDILNTFLFQQLNRFFPTLSLSATRFTLFQ